MKEVAVGVPESLQDLDAFMEKNRAIHWSFLQD